MIVRGQGIDDGNLSCMASLTTLAPNIVAAILDETLSADMTLFEVAAGTPVL